jgi:hypothetical protein
MLPCTSGTFFNHECRVVSGKPTHLMAQTTASWVSEGAFAFACWITGTNTCRYRNAAGKDSTKHCTRVFIGRPMKVLSALRGGIDKDRWSRGDWRIKSTSRGAQL